MTAMHIDVSQPHFFLHDASKLQSVSSETSSKISHGVWRASEPAGKRLICDSGRDENLTVTRYRHTYKGERQRKSYGTKQKKKGKRKSGERWQD